jgi:hypothetical protein
LLPSSEIQWVSVGHAKMFRPAEASYEKQACGLPGIALMSTDFEPRGRSFKTGITSAMALSVISLRRKFCPLSDDIVAKVQN